jgi:hypothetical protein
MENCAGHREQQQVLRCMSQKLADIVAKVSKDAAANFSPRNETSDNRRSIQPRTLYENRL